MKKKVLFLMGGRSGEHEVSIVSAKAVIGNLDTKKYEAIEVGITKDGAWVIGEDLEKMKTGKSISPEYELLFSKEKKDGKHVLLKIKDGKIIEEIPFDIVFPVLHGTYGEDGSLQGMLEMYDIPYAGPDLTGAVIGIDKVLFKKIMDREGIPNSPFKYFYRKTFDLNTAKDEIKELDYPVFVKPSNTGSSIGVVKVLEESELEAGVKESFQFFDKILIEKAIPNAREIEVSTLGNEEVTVSITGEVIPGDEFYSYDDKYVDNNATMKIPAEFSETKLKEIQRLAKRVYSAVCCMGMARVDFLVNGKTGEVYINEINTIPGFTSISMYPKLWEASGLSFKELVTKLIELGFARFEEKSENKTTYDSELLKK